MDQRCPFERGRSAQKSTAIAKVPEIINLLRELLGAVAIITAKLMPASIRSIVIQSKYL